MGSHAKLSEGDRQAILSLPCRVRQLDAGSYIVREGDQPKHCSLLLEGYAVRQKVTGTGARQIMALCIPGDAVDLQNTFLAVSDHAVQMLTRGKVADIPRPALQELVLCHPAIGAALIQMTLVESSIFREWVVNVGRRDSRARIAHLLCELALRLEWIGMSQNGMVDFPLTQEQLADCTGLTPVHTNRTLQGLRRDGLIQLTARSLTVLDWDKLKEAGDFDELYLHHRGARAVHAPTHG